jgi:hypothetical protein
MSEKRRTAVKRKVCGIVPLALAFLGSALFAGDSASDEKLKQRVNGFYQALQVDQGGQAEAFVREAARPRFRVTPRGKVMGFRIASIKPEATQNSAVVEVAIRTVAPFVGKSIEIPVLSRWKVENGEWFFDPDDPPKTLGDKFQDCYYQRQEKQIPFQVKFDKDVVDFGVVTKGKTINLKFPFTNQSAKEIKIEKVYVQTPFMKDVSPQTLIKPGKKGEIVIDLDTSALHQGYDSTIFVEFQPINECARIRMKGRIFTAKELSQYTPK